MTTLLGLHHIAVRRGDGLRAEFLELLTRAAETGADPSIVEIAAARCDAPVQAGPHPARPLPAFLPGNVVDATDRFRARPGSSTSTTKAQTQG